MTESALQRTCSEEDEIQQMNLVVVGHVDHGKSTIVGRLLADTDSLPDGKLALIQDKCAQTGKQFEYAFLLDALADEQAQGITIDAARIFFHTPTRHYKIIDAPGHIEFLKNMVTGASHAEAALLVIDACEGIQENSRRHAFMLSFLGIKSIIVLVNKMDQVHYSKEKFLEICSTFKEFLSSVGIEALAFIPVSGLYGDNIAKRSAVLPWYQGKTVLEQLDALEDQNMAKSKDLRLYVQDVFKFTKFQDNRRIVVGTVDSGSLGVNDEIVFYPSGKRGKIKSLELFNASGKTRVFQGEAAAFTLAEQIFIARGELATSVDDAKPQATTRLRASVFWLGKAPMVLDKEYSFKVGTSRTSVRIEEIVNVIDASSLESRQGPTEIEQNEVAECILKLNKTVSFDTVTSLQTASRFVLVDEHRISGGGIIREALNDKQSERREKVFLRNSKWIDSLIPVSDRMERYSQKPLLLLVTGEPHVDRKAFARALEVRLFEEGKHVYYLGMGNIVHGLDTDLQGKDGVGEEHIRRLAELANIMLDSGLLLIVSVASLRQADIEQIGTLIGEDMVKSIWIGRQMTTDLHCDLLIADEEDLEEAVRQMKEMLYCNRILFRPW